MAKAFVWPMLAAGILIIAVSAGLYFANKQLVTQFKTAYHIDAKAFVQTETERAAKSQRELALVLKVLPLIIIAAALLIMFANAPGITYCITHHQTIEEGVQKLMIAYIRYEDKFVKQNDKWLFAERKLLVDWIENR